VPRGTSVLQLECIPIRIPFWYAWHVSIQIAVRLPDEMVHRLDQLVAEGTAPSRASIVEEALRRELRRHLAERDIRILERSGEDEELLAATDWAAKRFTLDD